MPPTATVWAPHLKEWATITEADGLWCAQTYAGSASTSWTNQERQGPFILGELRRRFESGEIDGLSQIFVEGLRTWQQLSSVEGREMCSNHPSSSRKCKRRLLYRTSKNSRKRRKPDLSRVMTASPYVF